MDEKLASLKGLQAVNSVSEDAKKIWARAEQMLTEKLKGPKATEVREKLSNVAEKTKEGSEKTADALSSPERMMEKLREIVLNLFCGKEMEKKRERERRSQLEAAGEEKEKQSEDHHEKEEKANPNGSPKEVLDSKF